MAMGVLLVKLRQTHSPGIEGNLIFVGKIRNVALIKSISGIRGMIGGKPGENLSPLDIVKFTAAFGSRILQNNKGNKIVIGRDGHVMHFSDGASEWDSEQSIAMIKSYIASSPAPVAAADPAAAVTIADSSAN